MLSLKPSKCCIVSCISVFVTSLVFLSAGYIFFKKELDFQVTTESINISDIKSVQIINLKQSVHRRERYENMINTKFGGKFFNTEVKDVTMQATRMI